MVIQTFDFLNQYRKNFRHKPLQQCGLTETEFLICSHVHFYPNCLQEAFLKEYLIDKTTIAKACTSLEAKGLLIRKTDSVDRRRKHLMLTEAGEEKVSDIIRRHDAWYTYVTGVLTPKEQEKFEGYCKRMIAAAERYQELQQEESLS